MAFVDIWKITHVDRQSHDGLIVKVCWRVTRRDDSGHTAVFGGAFDFERGESFTPFEQLTEEQVLGWVKAKLDLQRIDTALHMNIEEKKTPKIVQGFPWSVTAPEVVPPSEPPTE